MYKKFGSIFFVSIYGHQTNNVETVIKLEKHDLNSRVQKKQVIIINKRNKLQDQNHKFKSNFSYIVLVLIGIILIYVVVLLFQTPDSNVEKPAELNESSTSESLKFFLAKNVTSFSLFEGQKETESRKFNCFPFYWYNIEQIDKFFLGGTQQGAYTFLPIEWEEIERQLENRYVFADQSVFFFHEKKIQENISNKYQQDIGNLIKQDLERPIFHKTSLHFFRKIKKSIEEELSTKENITDFILCIIKNSPTKEEIEQWVDEQERIEKEKEREKKQKKNLFLQ